MKNFRWAGLSLLLVVFLVLAGCTVSESKTKNTAADPGTLTMMTWNVQNLFDGLDNGFEYDEFLTSAGWSTEKYKGRVNTVSAAIGGIKPLPDIIMFQEIESLAILQDIAAGISDIAAAVSGGYEWSHFAKNPGAALGVGILSRFPIVEPKAHSITIGSETTPRPVLETRIQAENDFVVFTCHWKSKLGGDDNTESTRKASARVILRRIRELWEKEPELGVIVAGDLNENHNEFYRRNTEMICALMPDDPYCAHICAQMCAELAGGMQKDFIVLGKNKPPEAVHFPQETVVLFSAWMCDVENGSYYYKNDWETIDHFLVSGQFFTNTGWSFEKAVPADFSPFANAYGVPVPYNTRTGAGLSDHLPLLMTLKMKTD
ncbi:MAG: endonuclease/exonuclease/phosphatase family protein [Treponema sp.]|jgi:endonuclease/exonuclease/phosphatase family metal-dependent hydrolase|nr:endonuclease/exonuclease/phosphatase family protein [Treponema sp.]